MAHHSKLVPFILRWEGGFVNDPDDRGGATNMGITLGTYEHYCRRRGYPRPTVERLRGLSQETWEDIFVSMYWQRWRADMITSQAVANILVDWLWLSGGYGITIPQRVLGTRQDGIVGAKTLRAVNRSNPQELFDRIYRERLAFIDRICAFRPANNKFRRGWINRLEALRAECVR